MQLGHSVCIGLHGHFADLDAAPGQVSPGSQVRRELVGGHDHTIAWSPAPTFRDLPDAIRGVGDQSYFIRMAVDHFGEVPA